MFLLRKARGPRWRGVNPDDPGAVGKAADDLRLRPGEAGLSVYRVSEEEAREFALLWAAIHQDSFDKPLDFLLIPESLIPADLLTITPDGSGNERLDARHREIVYAGALTPESLAEGVIRAERAPFRIAAQDLKNAWLLRMATAPASD